MASLPGSSSSTPAPPSSPTHSVTTPPTLAPLPPRHQWKNSWCCNCGAWYASRMLHAGKCIRSPCQHVQCIHCTVSQHDDRDAPRVTIEEANGIIKSICCRCHSHHVGTDFSDGHCASTCKHSWCGDCMVYDDTEVAEVAVDYANVEFSACCRCLHYHGQSLDLWPISKQCYVCNHTRCGKCLVRLRKSNGEFRTMKVNTARERRLLH